MFSLNKQITNTANMNQSDSDLDNFGEENSRIINQDFNITSSQGNVTNFNSLITVKKTNSWDIQRMCEFVFSNDQNELYFFNQSQQ